jgi:hypothetical protein
MNELFINNFTFGLFFNVVLLHPEIKKVEFTSCKSDQGINQ